jgi:hypothetical protein
MTKTTEIADLIAQGKSNKEIKETVGCSSGLISQVRRKVPKEETDDITIEEQKDFDDTPDGGFIKKIEIEPDPETLTKDVEDKTYDLECGACGHEWSVKKDEQITECPECGVEF